jgi:UDP-N-acetylmuramate--alanine ligase
VYPAGEQPIPAADGRSLAHALRVVGKTELIFVENITEMAESVLQAARAGDVVMTMGAGSIANVPAQLQEMTAKNV